MAMITYRKAMGSDVLAIFTLIQEQAEQGFVLFRSLKTLYESIKDFSVAEVDGKIVAVGALHLLWQELAELRSLAVSQQYGGLGIGKNLVAWLLEEAAHQGLSWVLARTFQQGFFAKMGFAPVLQDGSKLMMTYNVLKTGSATLDMEQLMPLFKENRRREYAAC